VRKAAAEIPAEVSERLDTADKLSDEDCETIINISHQAIKAFSPDPEQETEKQPGPEAKSEPKPEPEIKPEAGKEVKPKPKAGQKEKG
jgi:hypothetical protein